MINRSPSPGDVIMKDRSPSLGDKLDCLQLEAPESALESVSAPESLQLAASESVSALESLQLAAPESVSAPESLQLAVPESSHLLPAKEWFIFVKVCLFVCVFLFFHIFGLGWLGFTYLGWVGLGYILNFFFFFFFFNAVFLLIYFYRLIQEPMSRLQGLTEIYPRLPRFQVCY